MSEDAIPQYQADLQASLMCDDVRQEVNGKFMLIGLFERLALPEFPAAFPQLYIVNRWCSGSGDFTQVTRIVCPDSSTKLAEGRPIPVKLQSEVNTATSVECFVRLLFPTPGTYWIEIYLDHKLKLRYPLIVEQRKNK